MQEIKRSLVEEYSNFNFSIDDIIDIKPAFRHHEFQFFKGSYRGLNNIFILKTIKKIEKEDTDWEHLNLKKEQTRAEGNVGENVINQIIDDLGIPNFIYTFLSAKIHSYRIQENKEKEEKERRVKCIRLKEYGFQEELLITEYIQDTTTLGSHLQQELNAEDLKNHFAQAFVQILFALEPCKKFEFTHYDLHGDNILVQKTPEPISIKYGDVYVNSTIGILKIIDYGTCHYKTDRPFSGPAFYNEKKESFPIFDPYYLVMQSVNIDPHCILVDLFNKILSFFGITNCMEHFEESYKRYYTLDQKFKDRTIQQMIDHVLKFPEFSKFVTAEPLYKVYEKSPVLVPKIDAGHDLSIVQRILYGTEIELENVKLEIHNFYKSIKDPTEITSIDECETILCDIYKYNSYVSCLKRNSSSSSCACVCVFSSFFSMKELDPQMYVKRYRELLDEIQKDKTTKFVKNRFEIIEKEMPSSFKFSDSVVPWKIVWKEVRLFYTSTLLKRILPKYLYEWLHFPEMNIQEDTTVTFVGKSSDSNRKNYLHLKSYMTSVRLELLSFDSYCEYLILLVFLIKYAKDAGLEKRFSIDYQFFFFNQNHPFPSFGRRANTVKLDERYSMNTKIDYYWCQDMQINIEETQLSYVEIFTRGLSYLLDALFYQHRKTLEEYDEIISAFRPYAPSVCATSFLFNGGHLIASDIRNFDVFFSRFKELSCIKKHLILLD